MSNAFRVIAVIALVSLGAHFNEKSVEQKEVEVAATGVPEATESVLVTPTQVTRPSTPRPVATVTPTPRPVEVKTPAPTPVPKSYQQIFTFSGNGAKKSEPFTTIGSRFKIKYTCSAGYCGAFLYKASGGLKDMIVNSTDSPTDETIIYGAGTYYIDANTTGNFSMTVEDYR